jgi:probable phosphoglycerate mutase
MKLILTRHGRTLENDLGIIQGHLPGTLSPEGKNQAKNLARRLKSMDFAIIFSSDLQRTRDTTKEILALCPRIPVIYTEALREQQLGIFQGKKKSELAWYEHAEKGALPSPPEGESVEELYERASAFLQMLSCEYSDKEVLLVTHSGMMRALLAVIFGKKADEMSTIDAQKNTSVTVVEYVKGHPPEVVLYNDVCHNL